MILFFDTETTGLPKNWKAPVTDLDNWPRLVQLAYLVYDFDGNLIHSCNEIIKPDGFTISTEASNVHGLTTEMAKQRGSDINDVFELFLIHLKKSKMIVAHNMAFDEKIIGSELIRLGKENVIVAKEKVCTMLKTVDLCKIDGPYGYKWPKLDELHRYLFNHDFEGAHDALADIQATAKCFWELLNTNKINCDYINKIKVLRARITNLKLNSKYNKTINDDSIPFYVLFESNPEFTLLLLSLHYPFNANEIIRFWEIIMKGNAHYSTYTENPDGYGGIVKPKLGLCFNRNVSWTYNTPLISNHGVS
jgi:DNA polymerase-3 subunit epsilon